MIIVRARRRSIVVEKQEDLEMKKTARQNRIFSEMEAAISERRCRMWGSMLKTVTFFTKATSSLVEQKRMHEATLKLQSMFRKTLYKMRGPSM